MVFLTKYYIHVLIDCSSNVHRHKICASIFSWS